MADKKPKSPFNPPSTTGGKSDGPSFDFLNDPNLADGAAPAEMPSFDFGESSQAAAPVANDDLQFFDFGEAAPGAAAATESAAMEMPAFDLEIQSEQSGSAPVPESLPADEIVDSASQQAANVVSDGAMPEPAAADGDLGFFDFSEELAAQESGENKTIEVPPTEEVAEPVPETFSTSEPPPSAEPQFGDLDVFDFGEAMEAIGASEAAATNSPTAPVENTNEAATPAAANSPAAAGDWDNLTLDFGGEDKTQAAASPFAGDAWAAEVPLPKTFGGAESASPDDDVVASVEQPAESGAGEFALAAVGAVAGAIGADAWASEAAAAASSESPPSAEQAPPAEPAPPAEEPLPPDPVLEDVQPTPAPLPDDHPQMQTYRNLTSHMREASLLGGIEEALGWDERCMMPVAGAEHRAEQITLLSGLIHDRLTDPRIGEWLNELSTSELAKDPHDDFGATLVHLRRQYEKRTKLPRELVEELAHTAALGQHAWQEARANDDFAAFAPHLTKMVELKRRQADALGFAETRYDALLDDFEPGELTSRVTQVLGALRDELVQIVAQVRDGGRTPDLSVLERNYPVETQRTFGRWAASQIGFDFERGRLDVTAHPFCTGLGPNDCRITTRYDENFFNAGFFGILHEAGHGIYDQGLRAAHYGLPAGEAVSMGIHESQSRMWEIFVGRSLPFWKNMYGRARRAFPQSLGDVTLGRFYFAVNDVRPSLIRVEADEFTYNLHILIRFELEQAMISGDLSVADLLGAWREKYKQYLGIDCPNDADGVLQDIHWSAGLFGYFPTYSLGNLYAAQFYEQADQDLGQLDRRIERGDFGLLRRWLNVKIHQQGRRYSAAELCERITGRGLSHEPLIRHLRKKYELLYAPTATSLDTLDLPREADEVAAPQAEESYGVSGAAAAVDVGYGIAGEGAAATPGGFGESGFGGVGSMGGGAAAPSYKARKKGSPLTALILLGGVALGGVLGTSMGYWILLWWKGPRADFLKIRDKLPSWIVPNYVEPQEVPEPEKAIPPKSDSNSPTGLPSSPFSPGPEPKPPSFLPPSNTSSQRSSSRNAVPSASEVGAKLQLLVLRAARWKAVGIATQDSEIEVAAIRDDREQCPHDDTTVA